MPRHGGRTDERPKADQNTLWVPDGPNPLFIGVNPRLTLLGAQYGKARAGLSKLGAEGMV